MESPDRAIIAALMAFLQNSGAVTRKKVIGALLKDARMRRVAKATLDDYERAEKRAIAPKGPEDPKAKPQDE